MDSVFLAALYKMTVEAEQLVADHERALTGIKEIHQYTLRAIDGAKAAVRYQTLKEAWELATGKKWLG